MTTARPRSNGVARVEVARRRVRPFAALAVAALLAGLWGGLARIGWSIPVADALVLRHGGVMVVGFVGTVISVERAIAFGGAPTLLAPAASALAGLALLTGAPVEVAVALATIAALAYTATVGVLWRRQPQSGSLLILLGGVCLVAAALAWALSGASPRVVPWWIAYLVCTVAGERLEMTRFQRIGRLNAAVGVLAYALLLAAPLIGAVDVRSGAIALGIALIAVAGWSVLRDPARRTIASPGLARFSAVGVLTAYGWLVVTGVLLLLGSALPGTLEYDAAVHAFFTGFVFSAIIAHEPIIAEAVSGLRFAFSNAMYAPLVLLGAGTAMRIASDAAMLLDRRRDAGLLQALAIVLLMLLSARAFLRGRRGP
jgi:hypothetical protein